MEVLRGIFDDSPPRGVVGPSSAVGPSNRNPENYGGVTNHLTQLGPLSSDKVDSLLRLKEKARGDCHLQLRGLVPEKIYRDFRFWEGVAPQERLRQEPIRAQLFWNQGEIQHILGLKALHAARWDKIFRQLFPNGRVGIGSSSGNGAISEREKHLYSKGPRNFKARQTLLSEFF